MSCILQIFHIPFSWLFAHLPSLIPTLGTTQYEENLIRHSGTTQSFVIRPPRVKRAGATLRIQYNSINSIPSPWVLEPGRRVTVIIEGLFYLPLSLIIFRCQTVP